MTLKIAVVAPIARPSVSTETNVNAGERRSSRAAMRRSARTLRTNGDVARGRAWRCQSAESVSQQHPHRAAILLLDQITDDVLGQLRSEQALEQPDAEANHDRLETDIESARHVPQRLERGLQRALAGRADDVAARPSSAALGGGLADVRRDEPLVLEAAQRLVNRAEREVAARAALDLVVDRDAVRILADAQHGEQHHLFELTEHGHHMSDNVCNMV